MITYILLSIIKYVLMTSQCKERLGRLKFIYSTLLLVYPYTS